VADGALSGLTVLDLSQNISGPYCTKLLADYGATVIKIEKPHIGDDARRAGPFPNRTAEAVTINPLAPTHGGRVKLGDTPNSPGRSVSPAPLGRHSSNDALDIEKSGLFLFLNTSKKSVTLDIDNKVGRDIFMRLAQQADIVVENFKPGTMTQLGLNYEALTDIKPDLIMASISYFGQTGPHRDWEGADIVAQAAGGLMYLTGEPGREPLKLPLSQAEFQVGLNAAVAILCAVYYRDATGEGQYIDISVQEAVASILEGAISAYSYSGVALNRTGARHRYKCPSTIMKAKDGYVHIEAGAYWEHFAAMVDVPQLLQPPLTSMLRYRHADEVEEAIRPWVASRTAEEIFTDGQEWRMPVAKVMGIEELADDPQYAARDFFQNIDHQQAGSLTYPGAPFKLGETPADIKRAPLLGEHNDEIYSGRLALSREEIAKLKERNVI
jgi:crotonobetainyl-CoA:carnitine CoA-transferase CaiB-like acyl-CoA transferase